MGHRDAQDSALRRAPRRARGGRREPQLESVSPSRAGGEQVRRAHCRRGGYNRDDCVSAPPCAGGSRSCAPRPRPRTARSCRGPSSTPAKRASKSPKRPKSAARDDGVARRRAHRCGGAHRGAAGALAHGAAARMASPRGEGGGGGSTFVCSICPSRTMGTSARRSRGLAFQETVGWYAAQTVHRYVFPPQEHDVRRGDEVCVPVTADRRQDRRHRRRGAHGRHRACGPLRRRAARAGVRSAHGVAAAEAECPARDSAADCRARRRRARRPSRGSRSIAQAPASPRGRIAGAAAGRAVEAAMHASSFRSPPRAARASGTVPLPWHRRRLSTRVARPFDSRSSSTTACCHSRPARHGKTFTGSHMILEL